MQHFSIPTEDETLIKELHETAQKLIDIQIELSKRGYELTRDDSNVRPLLYKYKGIATIEKFIVKKRITFQIP